MLRRLALPLALVAPLLVTPPARAGTTDVTLSASVPEIAYGAVVTLSGVASADPGCIADRAVELQWHASGAVDFGAIAEAVTTADGAFSFDRSEPSTGRYRAVLLGTPTCPKRTSVEVPVRVAALVDASVVSASTEVGSCVDVTVAVSPPKPGQSVDLQRRAGAEWSTIETIVLDAESRGAAAPCLGWEDVGIARFRARWAAQDRLNETAASPVLALEVTEAGWMSKIGDAISDRSVSVAVSDSGEVLYRHADATPRAPASNEKLLLAMACLDTFGLDRRFETHAAAPSFSDGVVEGDLWLLGRGDPLVGRSSLGRLADELVDAGLVRVRGSVVGSTTYFRRDWTAPGWNDAARDYINRPTALTFEGNADEDPEAEAARSLTRQLERRGVRVAGRPDAAAAPGDLEDLAVVESKPLRALLAKILRPSWNFGAEVLGKALGAEVRGAPGTIAKGAATIQAWVEAAGVDFTLYDNSGLSYDDRVTASGIVQLLTLAEEEDWGDELRAALPTGGQGTLEDRLLGVKVRAKTGTLTDISALSGWVFSERRGEWIEFSILSSGMSKPVASQIEDRIVRLVRNNA
jgi:D-alanyl-D-alanine carboxypeptidase/D-alanyl-D-alanine-endopeptidase (penicillin-binding protein 4)